MCKSAGNGSCLDLCRNRTCLCLGNNFREILGLAICAVNMSAAGESCRSGRPEAVLIALCGRHHTVGRHQNRTIELLKLLFLFPPCISVISCEMRIFLKCRIIMCRKHLGVCIDIYTSPFRLFQKHFQIAKVMTGDQNTRIFTDTNVNLCHFRIPIGLCIRLIQKSHTVYTVLTGLQSKRHQIVYSKRIIQSLRKCFLDKRIHFFIVLKQRICMLGIGRKSF